MHYGLRENGERLKKISQNQFCFSENVKCPIQVNKAISVE